MPPPARTQAFIPTALVIWIAGLTTPVAYLVVGWLLRRMGVGVGAAADAPAAVTGAGAHALPIALAIASGGWALAVTLFVLPLRHRIAEQLRFDRLRVLVVRFALIESIAILGLLMLVVGRSWPALVALEGWALALMVLIRPSAADATTPRDEGQGG